VSLTVRLSAALAEILAQMEDEMFVNGLIEKSNNAAGQEIHGPCDGFRLLP
jgi:hypothetical protein